MLPKIKSPIYEATIPSTGKVVKFRPFIVKEEKILLMARQSGEPADFFSAISQIVQNCLLDNKINVLNMPLFDVEYLFTKMRASSVSNVAKVSYKDNEDGKTYDFSVDLNKVIVKFPESFNDDVVLSQSGGRFKASPEISFTMTYPQMKLYTKKEFFDLDDDGVFDTLITNCLDTIVNGEEIHKAQESTKEEILDFSNSLPAKNYLEIRQFFLNLPTLYHEIKYKNANGVEKTIIQRTIEDFFTFG